jgi:NlpC/P60 family putative phage cell wall peptidase
MTLTAADRVRVVAEAHSWANPPTPYHHHARIKGVGVDCAHLLCGVFENCGLLAHVTLPNYPTDWHLHRGEELFLQWLARFAMPAQQPQAGDVAVFRFGRTFSHGAIMVSPDACVHAYLHDAVNCTRLNEAPLAGRPVLFWSLK